MNKTGYFITGTDTGVGKTVVTLGLMHYFQQQGQAVAGMKPVASGCERTKEGLRNDDALQLLRQSSVRLAYEQVNPYAFEPAIAPHIAAAQCGCRIAPDNILREYASLANQVDCMLVEGVGGWQVPLGGSYTMADLACELGLPVILVVGLRLGCLNHARLTIDAIESSGLSLAGWVANALPPSADGWEENINTIKTMTSAPLVGVLPTLSEVSARAVAGRVSCKLPANT